MGARALSLFRGDEEELGAGGTGSASHALPGRATLLRFPEAVERYLEATGASEGTRSEYRTVVNRWLEWEQWGGTGGASGTPRTYFGLRDRSRLARGSGAAQEGTGGASGTRASALPGASRRPLPQKPGPPAGQLPVDPGGWSPPNTPPRAENCPLRRIARRPNQLQVLPNRPIHRPRERRAGLRAHPASRGGLWEAGPAFLASLARRGLK